MSFYDAIRVGASGAADFEVERSLRFNDGDTPFLQRGVSSASNRKTFTYSVWCKRTENSQTYSGNSANCLFYQGDTSGNEFFYITFNGEDKLEIQQYDYPTNQGRKITTQVFRDPSAWYHIVLRVDTTNSTANDRIRLYVNGEQVTDFVTNDGTTSQNLDTWVNDTTFDQYIGKAGYNNLYMDGYLAEINMVDGSSLAPSSFGETNSATGQWVPIDTSALTFGTNGFRLKFLDNSGTSATTLGKDSSGNGNNYTPNNFSVSTGIGNDSVTDTPTNNFCTLNSLDMSGNALEQANLQGGTAGTTGWRHTRSTFALPSTGKWYWEYKLPDATADGSNGYMIGIAYSNLSLTQDINSDSTGLYGRQTDSKYNNSSSSPVTNSAFTSISNNDILQFAYDADGQKLYTGRNNTWEESANPSTGANPNWTSVASGGFPMVGSYGSSRYAAVNFGQQGFVYTPPTGYKALNSQNLPDPTILFPNKYFETLLYTGNSTNNRAITGLNFQPDFVWMKKRASSIAQHSLVDSLHGTTDNGSGNGNVGDLDTASNRAPAAQSAGGFESFDANGFTLGKGSNDANADSAYQLNNASGQTYVAWNWNAGDTDSATYTVKVVSDSGNKYRFNDFGTSAVTLDLAEGGTYTFDGSDSSMSSHPFVIGTAANGSEYSTGVTYQLDGASVTYSQYTSGYSSATTRKLIITVPASAPQLYYWCSVHSGMGGGINTNTTLGSSNFDGTIQTTVKASPTSGFSIIRYTGTGSDGTLGHGLGVAPSIYIVKRRSSAKDWYIQVGNLAGIDLGRFLKLNANDGISFASDVFAATADTSTVLNTKSDSATNASGDTYVIYCFSSVEGFSKFGSYTGYLPATGNGSFVYLGFRPAFLIVKKTASEFMLLTDSKRGAINPIDERLFPAYNFTESDEVVVDFVSNGFKARNGGGASIISGSGSGYVFFAFAESPFKNSRAR